MRLRYIVTILAGMLLIAVIFPSCAASSKTDSQRQNYMLHDKSQYARNKGKYKSSNKHVKQRNKNLKKIKRQQRR